MASGLAALTGRADGPPLVPPAETVDRIVDLTSTAPVDDPLALLAERAALAGWSRQGTTSCGGGTRLLPAADGWLAVNLSRPDDVASVPAWLGLADDPDDAWSAVAEVVATRPVDEVVAAGVPLGLALAAVPDRPPAVDEPVLRHRIGDAPPLDRPPVVVDLSSLWAGPLCSRLLLVDGARVVKVESTARPDGTRRDESGFFEVLNDGKKHVAFDLPSTYGLAQLRRLLASADVVIEGSRPRALQQWGIEPGGGAQVWVSITGHGRDTNRVGFGDDAAAAGGLVAWDADGPVFLADAVADPLTGIAAHAAVTAALAEGGRWLLDAALSRVAASVASPRQPATPVDEAP